MIRACLKVSVFLVLCVSPASAETVKVVSGEHAGFSRIVLYFKQPINWTASKTPSGSKVSFGRSNLDFSLDRVFDRMPASRFLAFSSDTARGALLIDHKCACDLEVFPVGDSTVAIDLRSSDTDQAFNRLRPRRRPGFASEATKTRINSSNLPLPIPANVSLDFTQEPRPELREDPVSTQVNQPALAIEDFNLRLNSEVSIAITEGLLDAHPSLQTEGNSAVQEVDLAEPEPLPMHIMSASSRTVSDDVGLDRLPCETFPNVLSSLSAVESLAADISKSQRGLVNSAGQMDADALQQHFQALVRARLLPEARLLWEEWKLILSEDTANLELLTFLEGENGKFLGQWPHCGPNGHLWAVLVGEAPSHYPGAVETAYLALALPLQEALLPILERRMRVLGQLDTVHSIKRATMLSVVLEEGGTQTVPQQGGPVLGAVDKAELPVSLIRQLDEALASAGAIPDSLIELATSIAVEHSETPVGTELRAAIAVALLRNMRVSEAFAAWDTILTESGGKKFQGRRADFGREASRLAETSAFLNMSFSHAPWSWLHSLENDAAERMAGRLEELGFSGAVIAELGLTKDEMAAGLMSDLAIDGDAYQTQPSEFPSMMSTVPKRAAPPLAENFARSDIAESAPLRGAGSPPDGNATEVIAQPAQVDADVPMLQENTRQSLADLTNQLRQDRAVLDASADDFGLQAAADLLNTSGRARELLERIANNPLNPVPEAADN